MGNDSVKSIGAFPMNTLAYQDLQLYGGKSGFNLACPSLYNNFMGASSVFNSPYNTNFMGYNPNLYNYGNSLYPALGTTAAAAGLGAGASALANNSAKDSIVNTSKSQEQLEKDKQVIFDYALKLNDESETFGGACVSGLTFAMFENPQNVKHPINSFNAMRKADKIFDIVKNPEIKALWESNPELMQRAYSQTHASLRRMESKWPVIQNWFAKPLNKADAQYVNRRILELQKEISKTKPNLQKIAKLTEELKAARGMDGYLPSAWNWIKNNTWNRIRGNGNVAKHLTASQRVNKKYKRPIINKSTGELGLSEIQKGINEASKGVQFTQDGIKLAGDKLFSTKGLAHLGKNAFKEAKPWFFFELAIEGLTKIIPTYTDQGAEAGNKQLLQSCGKAAASAAGWGAGRAIGQVAGAAAGRWAGMAAGAAIGSAVPGLGTAVGAVVGFACGCVGSWLATKGFKALFGKDESEKLAEAKLKETQEGQTQLLTQAYDKIQKGEAPKEVQEAMNNIMLSSAA